MFIDLVFIFKNKDVESNIGSFKGNFAGFIPSKEKTRFFFRYTFSAYPKYRVIYPKSKDPTWSALLRGASDTVNYCNIPLAVICQF